MHAVVELPGFVTAVRAAGLADRDRVRIIDRIAMRPDAGDVIPGTGGARITLFSKGEKIDLSQAERNMMRKELADLAEDYRRGVVRHDRSR